jgi:lysophospholipase L1-like esterase
LLPIDEEYRNDWEGRSQHRIKALNMSIKDMTYAYDRLFFVNVGTALIDEKGNLADHFHRKDGIHLNSKENAIWIDALKETLKKKVNVD